MHTPKQLSDIQKIQTQMPYGKDWCLQHFSLLQTYWQKRNGLFHRISHRLAQPCYAHIYKAILHHSLCCNVSRKGSRCSLSTSTLFNNAAHQEHLLREIWYQLSQRWIDQAVTNTWVDLISVENKWAREEYVWTYNQIYSEYLHKEWLKNHICISWRK